MTGFQILAVDDDPDLLDLVEELLLEAGHAVLRAASGEQAIQIARAQRPHLILLDGEMPGLNGVEVAKRLQADSLTAQIPIVAFTGSPSPQIVDAMIRAGCIGHIPKPFDPRAFTGLIREFLAVAVACQSRQAPESETERKG